MNAEYTQVQVTKETRKNLQKLRITKKETYDEIIVRLINWQKQKNDRD